MRVEDYFDGVDNINKRTLHYIINLKIHKYSDIFDNLDDSPLKLRSINKNIQLYMC